MRDPHVRALLPAALVMVAALQLGACGASHAPPPPAPPAAATAPVDSWAAFASRFLEEYLRSRPFFAAKQGRHEYDGQMPDFSAGGVAAQVARLKAWRAEAAGFDPAVLSAANRFERDYLLSRVDGDLFWLERVRRPFTNPSWYADELDPDVYLTRDYAPLAKRLQGYLGYARAMPRVAAEIRADLSGAPLPPTFIERGIQAFGGFADFYRRDVAPVFAAITDPQAQKDLATANEAAARAMDDLKRWLVAQRRHATGTYALGEPLFLEMLKATEQVDIPVADLLAAGRADLERNTQALREACAQYLPHGTLAACTQKMRADKSDAGAVAAARVQLDQLRAFVIAHHVVTVPRDEQAHVAESPPYARFNSAYISLPGPYDTNVASTYYIAPPDPSWSAAERAEYVPGKAVLLYTSVHEVWPGHFLQFQVANRNPSKLAAMFIGYGFAEGWAHYAEELMWEEGLGEGDPEQHIGQLSEALLRDVRYLSAIGLHTGGMTVAESERLFRERGFQDPATARQQAARGTYDPQYLTYTLCKLMIRKLRADWVARQPKVPGSDDPRFYWQAFNDRFLSYGGPPIPMVRREMVGEGGAIL